jgi:hypothetical protein
VTVRALNGRPVSCAANKQGKPCEDGQVDTVKCAVAVSGTPVCRAWNAIPVKTVRTLIRLRLSVDVGIELAGSILYVPPFALDPVERAFV